MKSCPRCGLDLVSFKAVLCVAPRDIYKSPDFCTDFIEVEGIGYCLRIIEEFCKYQNKVKTK